VWYDEYVLKPGDSLLEKISAGLRDCDRGIVVLSPLFFKKDWPQFELDGLFASETKERKILIPIWIDVTKADVLQFSPIPADRVAIKAADGIPSVVSQIRGVVLGENQTREVLGAALSWRFTQLGKLAALRTRRDELNRSNEGYALLKKGVKTLFDYFDRQADQLQTHLTISRRRDDDHVDPFVAFNTSQMSLSLHLTNVSVGDLSQCRLAVRIFGATQEEKEFRPEFEENDQLVWGLCMIKRPHEGISTDPLSRIKTGEKVVDDAFLSFADFLEKELKRPTRPFV